MSGCASGWCSPQEKLLRAKPRKRISNRCLPSFASPVPSVLILHPNKVTGIHGAGRPDPVPILLTVRELHHGGIERDVTKIALHIDRSRFEPHVASYKAEGM